MKYIKLDKLKKLIPDNEYNKGACDMLKFISYKQGWEESETISFMEFYKDIIK